jgi:hypothetical protein
MQSQKIALSLLYGPKNSKHILRCRSGNVGRLARYQWA